MPAKTRDERVLIARIASLESWAKTEDRTARTANGRAAAVGIERFERQVDPDGVLDERERAIRADAARRAHFSRLALRSVQARRRAREHTEVAEAAEAELRDAEGGAR